MSIARALQILEEAFSAAREPNFQPDTLLSSAQLEWIQTIVEVVETQKAVLAVLMTSLTKKRLKRLLRISDSTRLSLSVATLDAVSITNS
jgi:hypothetical protein